jgi:lycopene cyclase domain-containing protein
MREYTLISVISFFVTIIIDRISGIRILKRGEFYLFLLVILFFKLLVNGSLAGRGIVIYNPVFFLGIRILTIPLEDFLLGFSMVTLTVVFWEYWRAGVKE